MKRRKLLRSIGLLSLVGVGSVFVSSCKEDDKVAKEDFVKTDTVKESKAKYNRKVMKIANPEKPTDFELKHTPSIIIGDKDAKGFTKIEISVGSKGIIHPTKDNHWIDYLKLYKDDKLVGTLEIEQGMARGFSGFRVDLSNAKKLKAVIGCNLHGIWENTLVF